MKIENIKFGNAEAQRPQSFAVYCLSAFSAPPRFNFPPSAKLEWRNKANVRGLSYGG
jgi:hypothetical protein